MKTPKLLSPAPVTEVHLPRAPLARVIAEVRFPPIHAIRSPDGADRFQKALRDPYLNQISRTELEAEQTPNSREERVWRLADQERASPWRVSLGVEFVALETSSYENHQHFLDRLHAVVGAVEESFGPANVQRLGLRYVARMTGDAVERIHDLLQPEVLGIAHAGETSGNGASGLGNSAHHLMTEARFLVENGHRVLGRWGRLRDNATYDPEVLEPLEIPSWVLDLSMFTSEAFPFSGAHTSTKAREFADSLYWLFRQMVTDEFLKFYGGNP